MKSVLLILNIGYVSNWFLKIAFLKPPLCLRKQSEIKPNMANRKLTRPACLEMAHPGCQSKGRRTGAAGDGISQSLEKLDRQHVLLTPMQRLKISNAQQDLWRRSNLHVAQPCSPCWLLRALALAFFSRLRSPDPQPTEPSVQRPRIQTRRRVFALFQNISHPPY